MYDHNSMSTYMSLLYIRTYVVRYNYTFTYIGTSVYTAHTYIYRRITPQHRYTLYTHMSILYIHMYAHIYSTYVVQSSSITKPQHRCTLYTRIY